MSDLSKLIKNISAEDVSGLPIKGIMFTEDYPGSEPGLIYMDSSEKIHALLEETEKQSELSKLANSSDPFQQIISSAFSPRPKELSALGEQLDSIPGIIKRFKCGIVVRMLDEEGNSIPASYADYSALLSELRSEFSNNHIAVLNDCIYLLITRDEVISTLELSNHEAFEALLARHNAYAMIGNPSQWIKGLRVHFFKCQQTLPVAVAVRFGQESGKRILRYSRYSLYFSAILAESSAQRKMGSDDITYLIDPAVLKLTRYDRSFNSNLRDTLFIYLMNDRNLSATAKEMFVHRNTVVYKVNQIKDIIGSKLEDPYERHSIISGCMIFRYIEKYRRQDIQLPQIDKALLKK